MSQGWTSVAGRKWRMLPALLVISVLPACVSEALKIDRPALEAPATVVRQEIELPLADLTQITRGVVAVVQRESFDIVTVFWGTNRHLPATTDRRTPANAPATNGGRLSHGFAHVTIPKIGREKGTLQTPTRFALLGVTLYEGKEDPRRHFFMGDFKPLDQNTFISAVENTRKLSRRFRDEAFVFVHGYNVPFDAAIFRSAQLAYDLEFDGIPYVFSWPSLGSGDGYVHDKDAADASRRYLQEFLDLVVSRTGARRVHLIAHSMGSRLLTEALRSMPPAPSGAPRFEQVILAAPDIDAEVFREIAGQIRPLGRGLTVYASQHDKALWASRSAAIGRARVGEVTSKGPTLVPGIDTIDISGADINTFWGLNHSTFAERSPVLKDLQILIEKGTRPPENRTKALQRVQLAAQDVYWRYVRPAEAASR